MKYLDWDYAYEWQEKVNQDKNKYESVIWNWDCGFKLDYDGPILRISSRFYPIGLRSNTSWDGNVSIMFGTDKIHEKQFISESLDELKISVETYVENITNCLNNIIIENLDKF